MIAAGLGASLIVAAALLVNSPALPSEGPMAAPTSLGSPPATPTVAAAGTTATTVPTSAPTQSALALRVAQVNLGRSVFDVSTGPPGGHVYVRTETGLASVDPAAARVVSHLELAGAPALSAGLAFDEGLGFIYVTSRDAVHVVRPEADGGLVQVATIEASGELGPVAVDTRTNLVYVLDMGVFAGVAGSPPRSGALLVISGQRRALTARLELPGTPLALVVDARTGRAYVSIRVVPSEVNYVIQAFSLEPLTEIARVGTSMSVDLALHPMTGVIYGPQPGATGADRGRITVFDTRTNQAATFAIDIGPAMLAIDWIRDHLYAADSDGHLTISRLRGPAEPPLTFERLGVVGKPMGIAADPQRRLFYVAILEGRLAIFRDDHP